MRVANPLLHSLRRRTALVGGRAWASISTVRRAQWNRVHPSMGLDDIARRPDVPADVRAAILAELAASDGVAATLRELPLRLLAAASADEAMLHTMEAAAAIAGMECAGAYVADPSTGSLRLVGHRGVSDASAAALREVTPGSAWMDVVLRQSPSFLDVDELGDGARPPIVSEGIECIAVVPAVRSDRVMGCVALGSRSRVSVPTRTRAALESVAAASAVALVRFEAEEAVRRERQDAARVLEHMTDGFFAFDHDFRFTAFNPASARFLNRRAEDVLGRPWFEAFPEAEGSILHEMYYKAAREQVPVRFETFFPTPPYEGWYEISAFPTDDGLAVFFRIVTEQKLAEQALRESAERHRALFEEMAQGVVYQDAEGHITSANTAAERILGLTLDQMMGRTSLDARWRALREDGSDLPGEEHPSMVALRTGREVRDVTLGVYNPSNDTRRWLVVSAVPRFRSGESRPYESFATFTDITELRRNQSELEQALQFNREVISSVGEGLVVYDPDSRYVVWNPFMERLTGLPASEVIGRVSHELFPHIDELGLNRLHARALAGETLSTEDTAFRVPLTGRSGWHVSTYAPHRNSQGEIIGVIAAVRDVTERRQAAEHQRIQRDLSVSLLQASSLDDALRSALDALMELGGFDVGGVYLIEPGVPAAVLRVWKGFSDTYFASFGYITDERLARAAEGTTIYGDVDALRIPQEHRDVIRGQGVVSVANIPVLHRERIVAHITLGHRRQTELSTATRAALESVAATIGNVVARFGAEEALRSSEEQLRAVVEGAPDAITIGVGRSYVYANPAAVRLFGARSAEELVGQDFVEERIHPDFRAAVRERLDQIQGAQETVGTLEEVYLRTDGTPVHVEVSAVPLVYQGHSAAMAFVRETTERRKNEARLAALLQLHQMEAAAESEVVAHGLQAGIDLTESALGFIGFLDNDEAVCTILAWAPVPMPGCQVSGSPVTFRVADAGLWAEPVRQRRYVVANDYHSDLAGKRGLPEGHVSIARYLGVPVFDGSRIAAVAGFANKRDAYDEADARNATLLLQDAWQHVKARRARNEREALQAQLQRGQRLESLGVLAGGIAHDFNNILAGILGYGELALQASPEDSPVRPAMRHVIAGVDRARDLVNQILAFSRLSDPTQRMVRLPALVREALRLVRASFPATIEIIPDIADRVRPVMADASQIHQVIVNLCANAEYAMRQTGGTLSVRLSETSVDAPQAEALGLAQPGEYVCIGVSDTGCGIDAPTRDRMFEPFFTTKPTGEGTGLGLATSHGIVASHGGAISVWSEPGQGATFTVYLPAAHHAEVDESTEPGIVPRGVGRVLFVDDEHDLVAVAGPMLGSLGYDVTATASPVEALAALRADPTGFVALLTDQTMPRMTGTDLIAEARRTCPDLPVVLMTGFSHRVDARVVERLGVRAVLLKPYTRRELAEAIVMAVSGAAPAAPF
jgi:PAS domain S-box-containing protein